MTGLEDLVPAPQDPEATFKTARVISVSGHTLTCDVGGVAVTAIATDSCYPRADDYVVLMVQGAAYTAIGAVGGPVRQSLLTVTDSDATTVTGSLNGVSTTIPKSGSFSVSNGEMCLLHWSARGDRVWALPPEQAATSPGGSGAGAGGGAGGFNSGKTVYSARSMGTYYTTYGRWSTGFARPSATQYGLIFYGTNRFAELRGRTLTSIRAYLPKAAGPTSTISIGGHPYSGASGLPIIGTTTVSRTIGGWVSLPLSLASYLVSAGTGGLWLQTSTGDALVNSGGQIEIGWRL